MSLKILLTYLICQLKGENLFLFIIGRLVLDKQKERYVSRLFFLNKKAPSYIDRAFW